MRLNKELVPIISRKQLDELAENFLSRYYPEALRQPICVPIEKIAREEIGLSIEYVSLSEDCSILGAISFTDGETEVYLKESDEYIYWPVKEGTILIDGDLACKRNQGSVRYTISHEIVHWDIHKPFFITNWLKQNQQNTAFRCPKERIMVRRSALDWCEWQAEGIAAAILMPQRMLIQKAKEIKEKYQVLLNEYIIYDIISANQLIIKEIAKFFGVSKQACQIRLQGLNLLKDFAL